MCARRRPRCAPTRTPTRWHPCEVPVGSGNPARTRCSSGVGPPRASARSSRVSIVNPDLLAAQAVAVTLRAIPLPPKCLATVREALDGTGLRSSSVVVVACDSESYIASVALLRQHGFVGEFVVFTTRGRGEVDSPLVAANVATPPMSDRALVRRESTLHERHLARHKPPTGATHEPRRPELGERLEYGVTRLDPAGQGAWVRGEFTRIGGLRYRVLRLLVALQGATLARQVIEAEVEEGKRSASAPRNLMYWLRRDLGVNRDIIVAVRGGWALARGQSEGTDRARGSESRKGVGRSARPAGEPTGRTPKRRS